MTLTVAVVQFAPTDDKDANLAAIDAHVGAAADRGARLVVLPEYATFTTRRMDERVVASAEPLDGPSVTRLTEIADARGVTLVAGVNESAGDGRIHNTLVGLQGGQVRALYRKVHLYDAFGHRESDQVLAADPAAPELLWLDGFTIGMQTCYDLRFPEVTRALVDAGADVVALPAQWVPGPLKELHWSALLQARAVENTVYVLAAGQSAPTGAGSSTVLDPMGVALASLGEEPGVAVALLDAERLARVRAVNPALDLRRYRVVPGRPGRRGPTA